MAKRSQSKGNKKPGRKSARAASKVLRAGRTSKASKTAAGSALTQRTGGTKTRRKTLVLSGVPKGVSRAPEIHASLERKGRYFGDSGTRITRFDRNSR